MLVTSSPPRPGRVVSVLRSARCALAAAVLCALVVPAGAVAQHLEYEQLGAFRLSASDDELTAVPAIAVNGRGQYYAVWTQREGHRVVGRGSHLSNWEIETLSDALPAVSTELVKLNDAGLALVVWGGGGRLEARYRAADGRLGEVFAITDGDAIPIEVGLDSAGNAVFVWRADGGVYLRRYFPGIGFEPTRRITPVGEELGVVDAAVSRTGRVVVVWSRFTYTEVQIVGREMRADGSFGPRLDLSPTAAHPDGANGQPRVAIDGSGDAFVAWTANHEDGDRALGRGWPAAGGPAPTQVLEGRSYSENTTGTLDIQVAMNDRGDAFAVWHYRDGPNHNAIHGRSREADGTLGPVEEFNEGGYSPKVALDDEGGAVVAWANDPGNAPPIQAMRRLPDGSHMPPAVANRNRGYFDSIDMAGSCAGHAVLTWLSRWDDGFSTHAGYFQDHRDRATRCVNGAEPPAAEAPPPETADTRREVKPGTRLRLRDFRVPGRVRLLPSLKLPRSAAVRFELDAPARVTIRIERAAVVRAGCRPSRCRWRRVATLKRVMEAGDHAVRLRSLLTRGLARPGLYKVSIRADAGWGQVHEAKLRFRILAAR